MSPLCACAFRGWLLVCQDPEIVPARATGAKLIDDQDKHIALLVANDYETMEVLEQTFARAGFRVFGASSLEQVVCAMQRHLPDIVVCDTAVKELTRQSLQKEMPDDLDLEALPFIFLCSTGPVEQTSRHLDLNQYISKPFDSIALATLAERTLAYRQSLAQSAQADGQLSVIARKVLRKQILRELQRVQRYGGHMSICIFEILDQESDKPLQAQPVEPTTFDSIADFLPGMIRAVDLLARLSRKRFLWVMPETDGRGSQFAVQRLMAAFAVMPIVQTSSPLTMRAGLATAPDDGLSYDELLELAEQELSQRPIEPAREPVPEQRTSTPNKTCS